MFNMLGFIEVQSECRRSDSADWNKDIARSMTFQHSLIFCTEMRRVCHPCKDSLQTVSKMAVRSSFPFFLLQSGSYHTQSAAGINPPQPRHYNSPAGGLGQDRPSDSHPDVPTRDRRRSSPVNGAGQSKGPTDRHVPSGEDPTAAHSRRPTRYVSSRTHSGGSSSSGSGGDKAPVEGGHDNGLVGGPQLQSIVIDHQLSDVSSQASPTPQHSGNTRLLPRGAHSDSSRHFGSMGVDTFRGSNWGRDAEQGLPMVPEGDGPSRLPPLLGDFLGLKSSKPQRMRAEERPTFQWVRHMCSAIRSHHP